jgi:hypothetical protein
MRSKEKARPANQLFYVQGKSLDPKAIFVSCKRCHSLAQDKLWLEEIAFPSNSAQILTIGAALEVRHTDDQ